MASLAVGQQRIWIQSIQKRIGETATMLGSMKAVKMLGLEKRSTNTIRNLRTSEIEKAKRFRTLTVLTVGLCEFLARTEVLIDPLADRILNLSVCYAVFFWSSRFCRIQTDCCP